MRPLPLGFHRRLSERGVVPPGVPQKVLRDSDGKIQRDAQGRVLMADDPQNADYLVQREHYHQRVAALAISESLLGDENITWETQRPQEDSSSAQAWLKYADDVLVELEQAGLTDGDLAFLCEAIAQLSHLLGDHLRRAQMDFFSGSPMDTT